MAHQGLNSFGCSFDWLMFPYPDNRPSGFSEDVVVSRITLDVASDLRIPIGLVCLGAQAVGGTSMPKATVDEDRNPLAGKNEIRSAP